MEGSPMDVEMWQACFWVSLAGVALICLIGGAVALVNLTMGVSKTDEHE